MDQGRVVPFPVKFRGTVIDELLLSMDGEDEKENTERANLILSSLDLADKIKLHPMSLSGGEKQRVAIGSAIASNKEILFFLTNRPVA